MLKPMEPRRVGFRRHLASSPFAEPAPSPPVEAFREHDRVVHDRYGLGRVLLIEGSSAVVVDFGNARVRITAPFEKLTKL
jgi:hypothetical protein